MMAGISCWCIAVRMDSSWLMGSPPNFWKRGCAGPRNARSGRSWRQWRGANGGEGVAGRGLRWAEAERKKRSCKGWKTFPARAHAVLLVTCVVLMVFTTFSKREMVWICAWETVHQQCMQRHAAMSFFPSPVRISPDKCESSEFLASLLEKEI